MINDQLANDQREMVHLAGVQETLLFTLRMRADDYRSAEPMLGDRWAADVLDHITGYNRAKMAMTSADRYTILLRAKRLDSWTRAFLRRHPDATVLSLGCGLDSRAFRVDFPETAQWYDVDFPDVIELRQRLYPEHGDNYHLIASSVTDLEWLDQIPVSANPVLVVAEGLMMYLPRDEFEHLVGAITDRFDSGELLFDIIGLREFWVKMSPYDMWGTDKPHDLERISPRLTLLENEDLLAKYRHIPSLPYRLMYGIINLFPSTRKAIWPQRFRFGDN